MKTRILSTLLALAMIVGCVAGLEFTAGATTDGYVKMIATDGITVDGDLSDWDGIATQTLLVRQSNGSFVESSDEYVQVAVSPDSLYVALTVNDDEKTLNDLTRDHVRLGVILPNGEIGLGYFDCDGWTIVKDGAQDNFPGWWLNSVTQYNAFITANSNTTYVYSGGKVTVEIRACFDDAMRAQLVEGAQIKFCVSYYDGWEVNANTYNECDMKTFGTTSNFFGNGQGIDATLVLGDATTPVPTMSWETGSSYLKMVATDPVVINGDLSDWSSIEKHYVAVRQANGSFAESSDEYVQFIVSPDSLYVALTLNDDEKTNSGLTRDHVRIGVVLPNGEVGLAYFDCDTWAMARDGANNYFPDWWGNASGQYNAFIADNTTSIFVYDGSQVKVELRACFDSAMRAQLVSGAQLQFCVTYYDGWEINANTYNGCDMKTFGTTANFFGNGQDIDATLTLNDPAAPMPWVGEAYYVPTVATDPVTIDGNLADWDGVEKFYVVDRLSDGSFVASTDEYVQVVVSPDSLYMALTLNDDEKTNSGLTRDHVRLGVILPNGEIGLGYFDCDSWTIVKDGDQDNFPGWWLNSVTQYNAFITANSCTAYTYSGGKVKIEVRACFDDAMRAQLVDGAQLKFCVSYYDGWEVNANTYNDCDMKAFGTTAHFFGDGQGIDATITLGDPPAPMPWLSETYYLSTVATDPVAIDGDLSDWSGVEQHLVGVRQANGTFVESTDEYVQFIVSPDSLYVALTLNDDEKTNSGLTRDHVRLGVILPNGEVGLAYFDCDTWAMARDGANDYFPDWWGNASGQYNAFIAANTTSTFVYSGDRVTVELRACFDDALRAQLVDGAQIQFCVTYYDGWEINANTYNGCDMKTFGTTANFFGNGQAIDATLTLGDPPVSPSVGLQPVGGTLSVDESTAILLYYDKALVDAVGTGFVGNAEIVGTSFSYSDLPLVDDGNGYYVVTLPNVTPNYFGTDASFVLTNGMVTGPTFTYSVKQYCLNKLGDATSSDKLKAVCMDILNYGEATRLYVGTAVPSITDDVDSSYKAYATTVHDAGASITASGSGSYALTGAALNLRENVSLIIHVNVADGLENCVLVCDVSDGDKYNVRYSAATVSGSVATYVIPVGIECAYMPCTVYLKNGDDVVSKTYTMSLASLATAYESGAYGATATDLGATILNYATSIKALLGLITSPQSVGGINGPQVPLP